jgi:hypothetical protein
VAFVDAVSVIKRHQLSADASRFAIGFERPETVQTTCTITKLMLKRFIRYSKPHTLPKIRHKISLGFLIILS